MESKKDKTSLLGFLAKMKCSKKDKTENYLEIYMV